MRARPDDFDLARALGDRGFSPRAGDADALFELLAGEDRELARAASRALERLGRAAGAAAATRLGEAPPPSLRARLVELVGRLARRTPPPDPEELAVLAPILLGAVEDSDPRTRRNAIVELGKLPGVASEDALLLRWGREGSPAHRRSIAASLGKTGGERALGLLSSLFSPASPAATAAAGAGPDPELARIAREGALRLGRTLGRGTASEIDPLAALPDPAELSVRCRRGLEPSVLEEMGPALSPRRAADGRVAASLPAGACLAPLLALRTALRFGLELWPRTPEIDPGKAVIGALSSERTRRLLRALTRGPIRYRLDWAGAGHRRGTTYRVAEAIALAVPELVNDPTASTWEVRVEERQGGVSVELFPRGFEDRRFAYRRRQLPASSHPTVAAALARTAGVRPGEVVWDPFAGAGTELVERALLGPVSALHGSDVDPAAIAAARANLEAAAELHGLAVRPTLAVADARVHVPPARVTLVLTNPPLGRRSVPGPSLARLLVDFIAHAAGLLAPGGRLVWISPLPRETALAARSAGLVLGQRRSVDMGGFSAELQVFLKEP
jgi:23S rRNA G2445 N2-methylase RlmL